MDVFSISFIINDQPPGIKVNAVDESKIYRVWFTITYPNGKEVSYGSSSNPFSIGSFQGYVFTPNVSVYGGYLLGNYKLEFFYQDELPGGDFDEEIQSYIKQIWFTGLEPVGLDITQDVKTWIPSINVTDSSNMSYTGFNVELEVNDWVVDIKNITTLSLPGEVERTIDLSWDGVYYDSLYTVTLQKRTTLLSNTHAEFRILLDQNKTIEI